MRFNRADEAPKGFRNVFETNSSGKKYTYLRCSKTAFDPLTKKNIQCSYQIRKDHYKGKPHQCLFKNLESYIFQNGAPIPKNLSFFEQTVFNFVGKRNISISTAVSEDFYYMLKIFYEHGQ